MLAQESRRSRSANGATRSFAKGSRRFTHLVWRLRSGSVRQDGDGGASASMKHGMTTKMKRLMLCSGLPLALALAAASGAHAGSGTVDLTFEVGERRGAVMVALFDSEAAYGKSTPVKAARVPVGAGPVKASFNGLPAGRYAAKAFHDVDEDGALDVNAFDMPIEPYGFSNNALPRFGPPAWSEAAFTVSDAPVAQTIKLGRSGR